MLGFCFRVDKELSVGLTEEGARHGEFLAWDVGRERRLVARRHRKARLYCLLRHPSKPRLASGNFGIWRADFERVNGFDENYRGWGQEDDDLGRRLRRAGVRFDSILGWTQTYHLWHPPDPPRRKTGGAARMFRLFPLRMAHAMPQRARHAPCERPRDSDRRPAGDAGSSVLNCGGKQVGRI